MHRRHGDRGFATVGVLSYKVGAQKQTVPGAMACPLPSVWMGSGKALPSGWERPSSAGSCWGNFVKRNEKRATCPGARRRVLLEESRQSSGHSPSLKGSAGPGEPGSRLRAEPCSSAGTSRALRRAAPSPGRFASGELLFPTPRP